MKQNLLKLFLEDESGVTVIEIVLILVVNLIPYFGVDIVCIE